MRAWWALGLGVLMGCGSTGAVDAGSHTLADTALTGVPPCGQDGACDAGRCEIVELTDGVFPLCIPADLDLCEALRCPPERPTCLSQLSLPSHTFCSRISP